MKLKYHNFVSVWDPCILDCLLGQTIEPPLFKISAYGPVFTSVNNLNQAVESGSDHSDDPDYLGHFLMGQVGLIHELNYLDVMQTFNRSHGCMHVLWKKTLASDKQVNLGSDECTEPSLV